MFDVIIRHGRIVDGTGNPWVRGDVAIAGASIAARSSYRDPHQYPAGIAHLIRNGQVAVDEGRFSGTFAGRVVRKPA